MPTIDRFSSTHAAARAPGGPPARARQTIVLKANKIERTAPCAFCDAARTLEIGVEAFVEGTWNPVCADCVAARDPLLALSARLAGSLTAGAADFAAAVEDQRERYADAPEFTAQAGAVIEIRLHHYKGYKKPWAAAIGPAEGGRGIHRDFLDLRAVARNHAGDFGDYVVRIADPGLYQVGDDHQRAGYYVVWRRRGCLSYRIVTEERARRMIDLAHTGLAFDAARRRTAERQIERTPARVGA